jgi:hypothetical protein
LEGPCIPLSIFLLHKLDRIPIRVSHPRYPQFAIEEIMRRRKQRGTERLNRCIYIVCPEHDLYPMTATLWCPQAVVLLCCFNSSDTELEAVEL